MKGAYLDSLPADLVDVIVEQMERAPEGCSIPIWAQGGALGRVSNDAMAFTGRDAAFWIGTEAFWEDPALDDSHFEWGRSAMDAIKPFSTAGHYVTTLSSPEKTLCDSLTALRSTNGCARSSARTIRTTSFG